MPKLRTNEFAKQHSGGVLRIVAHRQAQITLEKSRSKILRELAKPLESTTCDRDSTAALCTLVEPCTDRVKISFSHTDLRPTPEAATKNRMAALHGECGYQNLDPDWISDSMARASIRRADFIIQWILMASREFQHCRAGKASAHNRVKFHDEAPLIVWHVAIRVHALFELEMYEMDGMNPDGDLKGGPKRAISGMVKQ
jgi:hypothetical protein